MKSLKLYTFIFLMLFSRWLGATQTSALPQGRGQPPMMMVTAPQSLTPQQLPLNSQMLQQQMGRTSEQNQPTQSYRPLLPEARNYAFGYNDNQITPYMTKTIAVPIGTELEEETQRPFDSPQLSGRTIKVFDPSVSRTRSYVENTVSIPFSQLLDLRIKFGRKVGDRYDPRRAGRSIKEKLEEIKHFFSRAFGYFPIGLDQAYILQSADQYKGDLDTMVVLKLFVPEEKEIEVSMETGDPVDHYNPTSVYNNASKEDNNSFDEEEPGTDSRERQPWDSEKSSFNEERSKTDSRGSQPWDSEKPSFREKKDWWDTPPSVKGEKMPMTPPESETSFGQSNYQGGMTGSDIHSNTVNLLKNEGVDLKPFRISKEDQELIVRWIKSFYASATTHPTLFATYPRNQIEDMVLKILHYMMAGKPQGETGFEPDKQDRWAAWLENYYLPQLRSGGIQTR